MKQTQNAVTAKQAPVNGSDNSETPLKKICADLGIDPKAARRKLRKAWRQTDSTVKHVKRERWTGDFIRSILAPTQQ